MLNTSQYRVASLLGQGGMAKVYLAEHKSLGHKVAIKVLNPEFRIQENIRKRFLEEARRLARMNHANLVKVSDSIEEGDMVAFVMEFIEGKNLREYLNTGSRLNDKKIASFLNQMIEALVFVHRNGLIHRDIKPSNFMVSDAGQIKLLDFGIAKNINQSPADYTQTGTGVQMGTPMYMSPEQVQGTKNLNEKSDQYSLGVVLWEMVTGRKPYDADTLSGFQIQSKIVNESLPLTRTHWDEVIQKATAKDPEKRYGSLSEMLKKNPSATKIPSSDVEKTVIGTDAIEEKTQESESCKVPNLKDNSERARQVVTVFCALLIIALIGLISNFYQLNYLKEIANGNNEIKYLSENNNDRKILISLLYFSLNFVCIFLFIKWFRRSYENAYEIAGPDKIRYKKNSALWAWFIPLINIYRPYVMVKEISRIFNNKIQNYETKIKTNYILFWWVPFLILQFIEYLNWLETINLVDITKGNSRLILNQLSLFSLGITMLAISSTILMIRNISNAELTVFKLYYEPASGSIWRKIAFWSLLAAFGLATISCLFDNFRSAEIAGQVKIGTEAYNRNKFETAYAVFSKEDVCEDKEAQYYLGMIHYFGQGVYQDYKLAKKWFEKSADQDYSYAQNYLGFMYENGQATGGILKPTEAFKWYKKSAEQENAEGQYNVAKCYLNGEGVDYDSLEAFRHSKLSADQNYTQAINKLAWMYANGRCVEKDLTESFNYYLKSAQLGDAEGQRELAMCYWNGTGVQNNFSETERWLRMAVNQGDPDAHWFLGVLLFNGLTGSGYQQEALALLNKAVDLRVYGAAHFLNKNGYSAQVKP